MFVLFILVRFFFNGFLGVGVKIYLSGYILDMFDKELLLNSLVVVLELDWGGICIDFL